MRGTLAFDPNEYDYGPATPAVRTILARWISIDWFEPFRETELDALGLFREHQRLAHAREPELFPMNIDVRPDSGDWHAFTGWCHRVRSNTHWDWKYSVLKKLSSGHEKACGWRAEASAQPITTAPPRPGDLFFKMVSTTGQDMAIWNSVMPKSAALDALPREGRGETARFYLGYAHFDVLDCIKWQLAKGSNDLVDNPFLPLLLCYAAGAYPFSLARDAVVMFRFAAGATDDAS